MRMNTATGYGSVARILHWLTAFVILGTIVLGLMANRSGTDAMELKIGLFSVHKTLGLAAFALALLRILWALGQTHPVAVHPERKLETFAAETVHWVLYVSMLMVPLLGWAEHAATEGFAPILWPFGQGLPFVPKSGHLAEVLAISHRTFAWLLIGAVALHVAGALKHALIDRDGVLARMVSGRNAGRPARATRHYMPVLAASGLLAAGGAWAFASLPPASDAADAPALQAVASQWQVTEGSVDFTVRQMGTSVAGRFDDWTAAITFDEATGTGEVTVTINMASVTIGTVTDQAKGAAFFDVAGHPTAVFTASIRPDDNGFIASGKLALKGYEVPLDLPFTLTIVDDVARMTGSTTMDRRDWSIGEGYADESSIAFPVILNVAVTARR